MNEDEIRDSPMARMRPPAVRDDPPPVLQTEELQRLLAVCAGTSFEEPHDTAVIRLLANPGAARPLAIESDGVDESTVEALGTLGHDVEPKTPLMGWAQMVRRLPDGSYDGAADPRAESVAAEL